MKTTIKIPKADEDAIVTSWRFVNNNSIKKISVTFGYSAHKINQIIDNHLKEKKDEAGKKKNF